ncbi:Homeobox protein HAZ1, partial [Mucuna pruriens]
LLASHLDYSGGCCGGACFLRPMASPTGELTSCKDGTAERMGTEQCELSEKTQIGSEGLEREQRDLGTALTGSVIDEKTNQVSANVVENSVILLPAPPQHDFEKSCQSVEGSCLHQSAIEQVSVHLPSDQTENKGQLMSENVQNEPVESTPAFVVEGQMQSSPAQANVSSVNELLDPPSGDVVNNISSNCSERMSNSPTHLQLRHRGKRNSKLLKKKYMLRSLGSSDRALRSKTIEKPKEPEPNSNLVDGNNDGVKRKSRRKKKKRREEGITDQFSRIRSHLRYLLNRISYEKSLIDAYSGEGWKGYSMEKLKPEKELQRAKSEILRRKLKIRDLFQNLDSLCAEGKLPESLFDSEGEIDSEDIFCAKCQSKELSTNNDIILCDGVCDRGFHQLCLVPPLLTEDIPPGDEGWLCPGCDCKDDCMDLVNDSFGTSLSLSDTWERVFPEAATATGNNMDSNLGLPSDDSDDDDYNPNGPEDVKVEGDESSSDESEYASASEKLEGLHEDQCLGLPSEDSSDGDYDPNAPDVDCKVNEETSSSDFTSDSEDLAAAIEDNMSPGQDGDIRSASLDDVKYLKSSSKQKGKVGKKLTMADELSSLLEPDSGQEDSTPVSGKRRVERLDYKKLYDETYCSDTSDDEDWTATATPSREKKLTDNVTPVSPNGNASNNSMHIPKRNKNKVENTNNSHTKSLDGCVKSGSMDKKSGSSAHKRLGEAAVQRLHKSFKENQYPDRTTKEKLAQEIGLNYQQVAKWFDNNRWSFRHSSQMETNSGRNASQRAAVGGAETEGEKEYELMSSEVSGEKSKTPSSRKRKHLSEPEAHEARLDINGSSATISTVSQELASTEMDLEVDENDLKAAGAELFTHGGRRGIRMNGWLIESRRHSILNSSTLQEWEQKLETSHLPEMVFGENTLILKHLSSGTKIHFNAFDALRGWKQEALPPVEVPAAAQWKFRSKPSQQVIPDYDYTFTTPYCGSGTIEIDRDLNGREISKETSDIHWEDCKDQIDVVALASKEPILFYDEVVLYEDELADNGASLLTVKVLRVDGVLIRLRETRMHCVFGGSTNPIILRESCWRESTFQALSAKGHPIDSAAYGDPSIISQRLPIIMHTTQKLVISS